MIFKEIHDISEEHFQFRILGNVCKEQKIISYNDKHYLDDFNLFQIIRTYNILFFKRMGLYAHRYLYCVIKLEESEEVFATRFLINTRNIEWMSIDDSKLFNHNPSFRHLGDYDLNSVRSPELPPPNTKVSLDDIVYPELWSKSDSWRNIILDMKANLDSCYGRPITQSTMFKKCMDDLDQINAELSINQLGLTS